MPVFLLHCYAINNKSFLSSFQDFQPFLPSGEGVLTVLERRKPKATLWQSHGRIYFSTKALLLLLLPKLTNGALTFSEKIRAFTVSKPRYGCAAHLVRMERFSGNLNLPSLSVLNDTLRASMSPFKVEQIMVLKLNQGCMTEVHKYNSVTAAQREKRSQCARDVQSAEKAAAGETVDVEM